MDVMMMVLNTCVVWCHIPISGETPLPLLLPLTQHSPMMSHHAAAPLTISFYLLLCLFISSSSFCSAFPLRDGADAWTPVDEVLEAAIEEGAFPGCVAIVGTKNVCHNTPLPLFYPFYPPLLLPHFHLVTCSTNIASSVSHHILGVSVCKSIWKLHLWCTSSKQQREPSNITRCMFSSTSLLFLFLFFFFLFIQPSSHHNYPRY